MVDGTDGRRDGPPSGYQPEKEFTPRKVKPDGASTNHTLLRDEIANAMRDEMLVCTVDDFLDKLAPFKPDDQWVDTAYHHLREKRLLGTSAEMALPVVGDTRRRSARVAAQAEAAAERQANAENAGQVQWRAFRTEPRESHKNEMDTFRPLEDIVKTLLGCPGPITVREPNGYYYQNCPSQRMASEILGCNFKVDSVIANPDMYKTPTEPNGIALAAVLTSVVMEFKNEATAGKVYENRKQLVSAANHIMNDDARKNWMYGITIENTNMSLWYFSRSYSMKSQSFDFTNEHKNFIRVFLSFLYASEGELGHDPSIHRRHYNGTWCYVYEIETEDGLKYYRTIDALYYPRSLCITGRKSRVWRVIEVPGLDNLGPEPGASEVALKDCWVDGDAPSEKAIQGEIFKRLAEVKSDEASYAWAPSGLKDKLRGALECPGAYFMKIELDWKLEPKVKKEKPNCESDPNLLSPPDISHSTTTSKLIPSSHTSSWDTYLSSGAFNASRSNPGSSMGQHAPKKRDYKNKRHYRVVYAEVGESLAHVSNVSDAVRGFQDIFIALTLMFLAGWVHRDVSAGNIILVQDRNGVRGKLNDLEYARAFDQKNRVVSTDPKTGTPYFMPLEIHSGEFLFPKPQTFQPHVPKINDQNSSVSIPEDVSPSLKYIFIHDLESLWWIIVWIFLVHVTNSKALTQTLFTMDSYPRGDRRQFFIRGNGLLGYLKTITHKLLRDRYAHQYLISYNVQISTFYANGERNNYAHYQKVYCFLWNETATFIENMQDIDLKLGNNTDDSRALGKRKRSTNGDNDSAAMQSGTQAGPSRPKKRK